MEKTASQLKDEQVKEMIDILTGYIITIKKHDLLVEYRHEVYYFKYIIKGLYIDLSVGKELKKANRSIYLALYKEHIEPSTEMEYIDKIFNKLYDNKNDVRNNLFYMSCIPEVKMIFDLLEIKWNKRSSMTHAARAIERMERDLEKTFREMDSK